MVSFQGYVPLDGGFSHADGWAMHPPFSFRSCRKENGPCTVQKKRTLRRVGLRKRRPPAAGGRRLAVPRGGQRRKRAALGETSSPGQSGIPSATLPAAAHASSKNSQRQRKKKQLNASTTPTQEHHPPRDGSCKLAEDLSVPEGKPKSALAPIRRPPSRAEGHCTGARQRFSLWTVHGPFLFWQDQIWGPRRAPRGGERRSKGAGAVFAAGGNGV